MIRRARSKAPAVAWLAAVGCALAPFAAQADVYTWIDAKGTLNVSNLAPPDDVRVLKVDREVASSATSESRSAAAAQQQVQALSQRVGQLEDELREARSVQLPMPAVVPPLVQYVPMPVPAAPTIIAEAHVDTAPGCDASWPSCTPWWTAPFYPAVVVVQRALPPRHFHRPHPVIGTPPRRGRPMR